MAEESSYLVDYLRKKGFAETRKLRHEYLSYYGLDQEYVYVLVSGVVKTSVTLREANSTSSISRAPARCRCCATR